MIKNKSVLEVKIGERTYEFMCSSDSPLGEVYDAISNMKAFVIKTINNESQEKNEREESEEKVQSCCI